MTDQRIVSIDPGMSTGVAIGFITETSPLKDVHRIQVTGGLMGFVEIVNELVLNDRNTTVVCEKFTPRPNGSRGGLTLKSVEPLRIEGFLVGREFIEDYEASSRCWRQPASQYFSGGDNLAEKKKHSREWLKDRGLYLTGKDVQSPDADDAISATLHLLGYLRDTKHMPTLKHYFKG